MLAPCISSSVLSIFCQQRHQCLLQHNIKQNIYPGYFVCVCVTEREREREGGKEEEVEEEGVWWLVL